MIYRNSGLTICIFLASISLSTNQELSNSLNSFAIDLLGQTSNLANDKLNIALSPYTIWSLLTIVSEGAKDNTAQQMEAVLRIPSNKIKIREAFLDVSNVLLQKSDGVLLDLDTAIFIDKNINLVKSFEYIARKFYSASLNPINFNNSMAAVTQINNYVAKATRNRIPKFVDGDDMLYAHLFITSIFYFKGTWSSPFQRNETHTEPFYDEKNNKIGNVNMMFQMGFFPYARIQELNAFSVELPYGKDKKMSMVIVLPFKGESLSSVLKSMAKMPFSTLLETLDNAALEYPDEDVYVHIPRFRIQSEFNMNSVLYNMGIEDVFDVETANLLGMLDQLVYLSRLIQRADIEVDEEGTTATAAAGAAFPNKAPPPRIKANRPFLYFIVDKPTRSILFSGRVINPNTLN